MKWMNVGVMAIFFGMLFGSQAFSGPPVKFPNCAKNQSIRQVANGSGVFFDETCSVAYVLPPQQGRLRISGLAPTMSLQRCGSYESLLRTLNAYYRRLELVGQALNGNARGVPGEIGGGTGVGSGTSLGGGGMTPVPKVEPMDPQAVAEYTKTMEMISNIEKSLKVFEDDKRGVAVGKIDYFLDWNNLVEKYRAENPRVHFERLPLEAGRILFLRKTGTEGESITGAVTQTIVGIQDTSGVLKDGTLQANAGSVVMGDAISGQVVLNYGGACPFVHDGTIDRDLSESQIDAYLAANFQYRYALQGLKKYSVSYNLASIAKHLQDTHTEGGFFSSRTVNSLYESNESSDEFDLTVESDQESYEYADGLRREVKDEVINRVLRELAGVNNGSRVLPDLLPPSPHGASVAAGEIQKCPWIQCQITSGTLRVLDSIFGNSSAVANYIKTRNGVSRERVTEKKMFSYAGSSLFSARVQNGDVR